MKNIIKDKEGDKFKDCFGNVFTLFIFNGNLRLVHGSVYYDYPDKRFKKISNNKSK